MKYDREEQLKIKLNSYLIEQFELTEKDYYSLFDIRGIVKLKSVLSDINNILTLKVTLAFSDWLAEHYSLDQNAAQSLKRIVLESKPNSNGYDIWLGYPVTFVGEVKCNIPINNSFKYGAQQRKGIERDISGLIYGKRKASINSEKCPKFIAFLDLPEVRKANEHLLSVSSICREHLVFVEAGVDCDRLDLVYGVYVSVAA
ncbi:hypothetical protein AB9X29_004409 [Vibrio vulnificus]